MGVRCGCGSRRNNLYVPEDEGFQHIIPPKKLAPDLIDAVGREEAAEMFNFAANENDEDNIFDRT